MSSVRLTKAHDTGSRAMYPNRVYYGATRVGIAGPGGPSQASSLFIYFPRPFPVGVRIRRATLTVHTYEAAEAVSQTLTLNRLRTRPTFSRLTWANQPEVVDPAVSVTRAGPLPDATRWSFDVTTHMQQISDGLPWTGWRMVGDDPTPIHVYTAETQGAQSALAPVFEVEWSDAPDTPQDLTPADGLAVSVDKPVLTFGFVDLSGDTTLSSVQVEIADNSTMTANLWDSGVVDVTEPSLDLAATSFPGITPGATVWWRVRVRDGDELWSGWSAPAQVSRETKGTLTMTEPGGATVMDPTPSVAWTLTGRTQRAWRVRVRDLKRPAVWLFNSRVRATSETAVEVPAGVLRWDDRDYQVILDVWDTVQRIGTPGDLEQYQVSRSFRFDKDASVPTVSSLSARPLDPAPGVELEWAHDSAPDRVVILRDGEIIANLDPLDHRQADGTYRWVDVTARPRRELTYYVRNIVAGRQSFSNEVATVRSQVSGVWLTTPTEQVRFIGTNDPDVAPAEDSEVLLVGDRAVVVTRSRRGYEGSVSGELVGDQADVPDVSAQEWRDRLLAIRRDPRHARLVYADLNVPVGVNEIQVSAQHAPDGQEIYAASCVIAQGGAREEYGL